MLLPWPDVSALSDGSVQFPISFSVLFFYRMGSMYEGVMVFSFLGLSRPVCPMGWNMLIEDLPLQRVDL